MTRGHCRDDSFGCMEGSLRLSIRPATAVDYDHFVRLFAELRVDDPVPTESHWRASQQAKSLIVEHENHPIGYGVAEALKDVGYVRQIVVDPAYRRQRVGRRLMDALAARLRLAGCTTWRLNVKIDNIAAQRLYEMLGLKVAYRSTVLRMAWSAVERLPVTDQVFEVHTIQPADDAVLEAMFDVTLGQLADHRAREGQVLLRIGARNAPVDRALGLASFAPCFPGASPLRVADTAAARALLQAIRQHSRAGDAEVNLVIENDDATVALLRGAGAIVRFEMYHYRGELPLIEQA